MVGSVKYLSSRARARNAALSAAAAAAFMPAPPHFNIVFDSPQNAGGVNPATGPPYPAVGQYADTTTNTVHTTPGFNKRLIAQDVGQLVGYNVLNDGDRHFFSKLLGTDPTNWTSGGGANPGAGRGGDEAFASYYAVAATGGLKPPKRHKDGTITGESLAFGDTPIDPKKLKLFTAAMVRLGQRQHLQPYKPRDS